MKRLAVLCLLLGSLGGAQHATAQEFVSTLEVDTNRPGADLRSFVLDAPDPQLCARACQGDMSCAAFTYTHPAFDGAQAVCWLKGEGTTPEAGAACCVSGVVAHLAPAAPVGGSVIGLLAQGQSVFQPIGPLVLPQQDPSDLSAIATPAGQQATRDCFTFHQDDAARSQCLTEAAVRNADEEICAFDATYECHRLAANGLMSRCRELGPEQQAICFQAVAVEWREPDSCVYGDNSEHCVATIAVETGNPQLLNERLGASPDYDLYVSMYASMTGDVTVIDWIENGDRADMAQIMTIAYASARGQPLPDWMCSSWRGDGSEGLLATMGDYSAAAADFCRRARSQAEALRAAAASMTQEQLSDLLQQFEAGLARGENPDALMAQLIGARAAPAAPRAGQPIDVAPAPIADVDAGWAGDGLLGQGN